MKLAFITPRYGAEISSGPEHACRLFAEQLANRHDVDVITTTARDSLTWRNEYTEGADKVRGVLVRRFAVSEPHDRAAWQALSEELQTRPRSRADELNWVRRLGPWSPGLLEHLKRAHRTYDALVFFSLHHASTVHGAEIAPERSLLFPYLQLSPALRFGLWSDLLRSVSGVGLFSGSEVRLLREYLQTTPAQSEVVGIGIEPSRQQTYPRHQQDPADAPVRDELDPVTEDEEAEPTYLEGRGVPFRRRHRLYGPMVVYGGRVDADNGCEEMLEYFDTYADTNGDTSLVLLGAKMMKVPDAPYLRQAGVLPERDRMAAYEAAEVTIAPASDDLLTQSLLESLAVGTPVLASARNDAAVEHCRLSGGGLYYADREEFAEGLRRLLTDSRLRDALGESGRTYVALQHRWEAVLGRFERLVTRIRKTS